MVNIAGKTLDVDWDVPRCGAVVRDVAVVWILARSLQLVWSVAEVGPVFPAVGFPGWDGSTGAAASRSSTCCWLPLLTPI